jgi:CBS domain-containing protein
MKVREMMSAPVRTIRPQSTLAAAGMEMTRHDCGVLPVVDANRGVVGMISDRDICIAVATHDMCASALTVADVAALRVCSIGPDEPHRHALELMRSAQVRRLAVLADDATLIGILSIDDIVRAAAETPSEADEPSYDEIVTAMKGICRRWHSFDFATLQPSGSIRTGRSSA